MSSQRSDTQVLLIGAGMIAHDQILPTLLQMRREGAIGEVSVCSQRNRSVEFLASAPSLLRAFPDVGFNAVLDPDAGPNEPRPDHYQRVLANLPERSVVVVAVPDQLHREIVLTCLRANQHVCCVKPLVLKVRHALEIERGGSPSRSSGRRGISQALRPSKPDGSRLLSEWAVRRVSLGDCPPDGESGTIGTPTSRTGLPPTQPIRSCTSGATTST